MAIKSDGYEDAEGAAHGIVAEINITPLTDIFLVLLIIFMVTSSAMSQMGVNVSLPQAGAVSTETQPEGVIISLLPQGGIRLNQKEIGAGLSPEKRLEELTVELKKAFTQTQSRLVVLEGDRQAFLGLAVQVMDYAKKAGAEKFAIATAP